MDRVWNEEVCRRAGIESELENKGDQRVLRWFGHVDRMDEYRIPRRMSMVEVSRELVMIRPRLGWIDGVKVAMGSRAIMVEAERQCAKNRKEWRSSANVDDRVSRGHT